MGLYASFTPEDLGYRVSLTQTILGEILTVDVEYGPACEAFCETFLEKARELVPVDTGYLRSTIEADTDGFFCECMADAEYAQYVEYGTWKMDAQPYFEPAIDAGLEAFCELAGEAMDEAQEILQDMCEDVIASAQEAMGGGEGGSFLGDIGGALLGGLMLLIMFPILVNLYGILKAFDVSGNFGSDGRTVSGGAVEVIIT